MRKIFISFFIVLVASCMNADFENQDLCTYVICGEQIQEKVNITVYNNAEVDFEQIIWSLSGQVDTINVLAFDQFSCWVNYESIQTAYLFAHGFSSGNDYLSDTYTLTHPYIYIQAQGT